MHTATDLDTARRVLGNDVIGADAVGALLGEAVSAPPIPYAVAELEAAAHAGECLILRVERDAAGPLTLSRLIERVPDAFDQRFLRKMGYQLKDDWGIALEPLAAREQCAAGWMLVRKQILDETRNQSYATQTFLLTRYAEQRRVPATTIRRRSAVEIVYDLILYRAARGERLLATTWDWSVSQTMDEGYLNVGGFGAEGMQILSYSPAVRHGALGVCPARLPGSLR